MVRNKYLRVRQRPLLVQLVLAFRADFSFFGAGTASGEEKNLDFAAVAAFVPPLFAQPS